MRNNRCTSCYYYSRRTHTCDYILLTERRRPCPPGARCNQCVRGVRHEETMRTIIERTMKCCTLCRNTRK